MAARPRVLLPNKKPDRESSKAARQKIEIILAEESKNESIILKHAFNRNILLVGPLRSGKTTVKDTLQHPYQISKQGSFFSQTVLPEITRFIVEPQTIDANPELYHISIMDCPGFNHLTGELDRDIEILKETIKICLQHDISHINVVFYVMAYSRAINPPQIRALEEFIKLFEGAEHHIHFLVTRCEDLSLSEMSELEQQYRADPGFTKLIEKTSSKFHFFGCIPYHIGERGSEDLVKLILYRVVSMRKKLFETIFKADETFDLTNLKNLKS